LKVGSTAACSVEYWAARMVTAKVDWMVAVRAVWMVEKME
jgi:hypothetical protein